MHTTTLRMTLYHRSVLPVQTKDWIVDLWLANFSVVSQIRLMPHYHHQVQQVVEFMRLVSIAVVGSATWIANWIQSKRVFALLVAHTEFETKMPTCCSGPVTPRYREVVVRDAIPLSAFRGDFGLTGAVRRNI